jgi:hypothetical protein
MPTPIEELKIGNTYTVSDAKGVVATGQFNKLFTIHPYMGHPGPAAEIVETGGQSGLYNKEYTFEEVKKGGRRGTRRRRARKTRRNRK